jgi:hypothetical protein
MLTNFVDRADVWVIDCGCRARFLLESFYGYRVARDLIGKKLECDLATKLQVFGAVDHTHAASAQFLPDTIVGNGLAGHRCR